MSRTIKECKVCEFKGNKIVIIDCDNREVPSSVAYDRTYTYINYERALIMVNRKESLEDILTWKLEVIGLHLPFTELDEAPFRLISVTNHKLERAKVIEETRKTYIFPE